MYTFRNKTALLKGKKSNLNLNENINSSLMWTEHTEYEEYHKLQLCTVFRYQHNNTLGKISSNYRYRKNPKHTPLTYILLNSNIFLAQCLLYKLLFWRVAMNTFKMTLVLLKRNCKMYVKWLSEQFWRCCLCIYVLIETADNEITASVRHTSVYVVNKTRLCHSFIHSHRDTEYAGFIFKSTLWLNIYRY